jgi:hypothetical protein
VLAEDLADIRSFKWRAAGQTLVKEDSQRVEVGTFVDRGIEQAGHLGGQIAGGTDGLVPQGRVKGRAAGESEVDQGGGLDRIGTPDDHIGRLDVPMEDAKAVGTVEGAEQVTGDDQGAGDREWPIGQAGSEVLARKVRLDEVKVLVVAGIVEQRVKCRVAQPGEYVGFVFQPDAHRRGDRVEVEELDHHRSAVSLRVRGQVGVHPMALFE